MDGEVVRSLYRMLYRGAKRLDAAPASKALLRLPCTDRYDFSKSMWVDIPHLDSELDKDGKRKETADQLASRHLSSILGGGLLYRPQTSACKVLREAFRHPVSEPEKLGLRIDTGFVAMRVMSTVLSVADSVLQKPPVELHEVADSSTNNPIWCKTTGADLEVGSVLVAHPLVGGIFGRKLILLYDYEAERGASGLVINGPVTAEIALDNLLSTKPSKKDAETRRLDVYNGGPVMSRTERQGSTRKTPVRLNVLHTHGDLRGAQPVCPGLFVNFKREDAYDKYMQGELKAEDLMIIQGYAGWGPNQLEGELRQHTWFASKVEGVPLLIQDRLRRERENEEEKKQSGAGFVELSAMNDAEEMPWQKVLKGLGGEYAEMWRIPRLRESEG
mmetsp:Transcript_43965/g.171723  ORF Transcript_43965/g.171723 Transcript_43965/m.171723 type:complete len:388 (-) Transcript_43965:597-1760(-)